MKPFWFVWNENGRAPTHKHDSFERAQKEADRLAHQNGGQTFVVLESVCAVTQTTLHREDLRPEQFAEIPW